MGRDRAGQVRPTVQNINPQDQHLLGIKWRNEVFLDTAFPFGLRSAPKILAIADVLVWVMLRNSIHYLLHYLDDLGRPDSPECLNVLSLALNTCEMLGVTVAQNKTEGPLKVLTFLGITIDMAINQLRLPPEKLKHRSGYVARGAGSDSCYP